MLLEAEKIFTILEQNILHVRGTSFQREKLNVKIVRVFSLPLNALFKLAPQTKRWVYE